MITEKLGLFYLGKNSSNKEPIFIKSQDLTTHAVILGTTGSGKTGLGITLLEEAAIDGVPSIIIDPKGDLSNLKLRFPLLDAKDFIPWVDPLEAEKKGMSVEAYAKETATSWKEGILSSNQSVERIKTLQETADCEVYTPGSRAGKTISLLNRLDAPEEEVRKNPSEMRDQVISTVSGLLGLAGISADPMQSADHILISTILEQAWMKGESLDLPALIKQIQRPSFTKVGVFDLETFMPAKERLKLAMRFNNLVASASFQSWMEGEPIDIQRLLWTKEGKPRMAVMSIAHLTDQERMFFVTLLLNHLIGWMRKQSGTTSLRALLYMDEIFGYFPPSMSPPSKLPMLTLLKQARAYGLGVVLSTQNPVDLDYKGLANTGTWMIGKLQTENDKKRLLDGLQEFGKKQLETLVSGLKKREFILKTPGSSELERFFTRWTLSYLKGPLTLKEIAGFYPKEDQIVTKVNEVSEFKFEPTIGLKEVFKINHDLSEPFSGKLLGVAKVHFVDKKRSIDIWKDVGYLAPVKEGVNWDEAEKTASDLLNYQKIPPEKATYGSLNEEAFSEKNIKEQKKKFISWLYRNQILLLMSAPTFKFDSYPNESERDFLSRLTQFIREKRDAALKKLDSEHVAAYEKLQEKLRNQEMKRAKEEDQVGRQKFDTYVSIGSTLLGALLGSKSGAIEKAGTSARRAARIGKEQKEAEQAKAKLSAIKAEMEALSEKARQTVKDTEKEYNISNVVLEKVEISPRKSDIILEDFYLAWV